MKLKYLLIAGTALMSSAAIAAGTGDKQSQGGASSGASSQTQGMSTEQQSTSQQAGGSQQGSGQASAGMSQQHDQQTVRQVQKALNDKGFDAGPVDGIMGPLTQRALKNFQEKQNIEASGQPDQQTLSALGVQEGASVGGQSGATGGSGATSGATGASGATSGATGASGAAGSGMSQDAQKEQTEEQKDKQKQ